MNWKRGFGAGLAFAGIYILFTARVLTGAAIGVQKKNLLGWIGLSAFIAGLTFIWVATLEKKVKKLLREDELDEQDTDLEDSDLIYERPEILRKKEHNEAHNAANYQKLKEFYREKKTSLPYNSGRFTQSEISLEGADSIRDWANRKVESGKWVELKAITIRSAANQRDYPQGTSLCRYWGPEKYKYSSGKKLESLYMHGKIGKTHEIVRGSDKYKEGSSLAKGDVSMPPAGAGVLHRHWEVEKMHLYRTKNKKED